MDETVRGIIAGMRAAAPPGLQQLDAATSGRLRDLTRQLITASPSASAEHARFVGIARRGLELPEADLSAALRGATILVTGGTGCIGSTLMTLLAGYQPRRLVSVSRGITSGWPRQGGAEYLSADIRDGASLGRLVAGIAPDVIFHVAAQRAPGLAEVEVHRTVSTNMLGTRNVVSAALLAGVPHVVHASTGKALRPYSPEVYTASKRAAEWSMAELSATPTLCSAARFTHVVDNSIIYRRLRGWADAEAGTIRLHCPDIEFYVQSGLESAQLLLLALVGAERGEFRVFAMTELGWPVSLLDLALGVLADRGSQAVVYFSGYDAGYEEVPFPGLYDPATAGDVSPLMSAFEAAAAVAPGALGPAAAAAGAVDAFRLEFEPDRRLRKLVSALEAGCERTQDPSALRGALNELSWSLLDATLRAAPAAALARSAALAKAHWHTLGTDHRRVLETLCDLAADRDASGL